MLSPGMIIDNTYQIIRQLGQGGTAVVYMAYHLRLKKNVVLKNILVNLDDNNILRNEVDTLKELRHSSLPQVYDFLQLPDGIFTVIDYVDGEDFEKAYYSGTTFTEEQLLQYTIEIAEVLDYMHKHTPPLLHSDLKPGNVMLRPDGGITLIDFNISVWLGGGILGYSDSYASPEQCLLANEIMSGRDPQFQLDGRSDIFSLGATMYFMLAGFAPALRYEEIIPLSVLRPDVSQDYIRIVEKCMAWNRDDRWDSANQLLSALNRLRYLGRDYRRKWLLQSTALLLSGLLIVSGSLCLWKGVKVRGEENLIKSYQDVIDDINMTPEERYDKARNLLEKEKMRLDSYPDYRCNLLQIEGDCLVDIGESLTGMERKQQLLMAASKYYECVSIATEENLTYRRVAVLCATLYAENGESASLDRLLSAVKKDYELTTIINALQLIKVGSTQNAKQTLTSLSCQDPDLEWCRYYVLSKIAATEKNVTDQALYLEQALTYGEEPQLRRNLGTLRMQQRNYKAAEECFKMLIDSQNDILSDRVNYATAIRAGGNPEKALEVLETLNNISPNNYHILLQLAIAYSECNRRDDAKAAANEALNKLSGSNDIVYTDDEVQTLRTIKNEG